jgi:hypothetical protein
MWKEQKMPHPPRRLERHGGNPSVAASRSPSLALLYCCRQLPKAARGELRWTHGAAQPSLTAEVMRSGGGGVVVAS